MGLIVESPWVLLVSGWLLMAVIMLRVDRKRTRNAGFVDVCRACDVGVLAVIFAALGDYLPGPPRPDPEART